MTMIREIDDALREIVRTRALDGSDVEVVLDAPTTDWAARRNAPTVNLYLYDIREDTRWRERGLARTPGPHGTVAGYAPPPRMFKLSYLVTAWTARPEDEHRLLDSLLGAFLGLEVLPAEVLTGNVAAERIGLTVGLPPPEDRGFADVWSSLGGQLKPSIDVVVIAPFRLSAVEPGGPPVTEPIAVTTTDRRGGAQDTRVQRHVPPPARARTGATEKATKAEKADPASPGARKRAPAARRRTTT